MFDIFFGWRKASKCKKLIKQVQCRLKLLKNKKGAIWKQLREDVVQLIKDGYDQTAFNRVEQIMKHESTMAAYEMLDNFCEFILLNLSYIRKHKDCPNDVNEAVSSLMFASARCGDLPELQLIRKLFGERYGRRFETTAVELIPGNLVSRQIKEKLSTNCITDDEKRKRINEIARNCLQPELLALEYRSDWNQKQNKKGSEDNGSQVLPREVLIYDDMTDRPKKQAVNTAGEIKRKGVRVDSATSTTCESHGRRHQDCDGLENYCSAVDIPDQLETFAANCKEGKGNGSSTCNVALGHEEWRKTSASSCESLPQFPEERIVYLDDVLELCSSSTTTREGDQRLFKFKTAALPKRENGKDSYDQTDIDQSESWSEIENSSSKSSGKSRNGSGKGSRRRSVCEEMQKTKDIEGVRYNGQKHQSQNQINGNFCRNVPNRSENDFCFDHKTKNCNLKCPYYTRRDDGKVHHEISPWKQRKRELRPSEELPTHVTTEESSRGELFPTENLQFGATDKEMEWVSFYKKPRRRSREPQSRDLRSAAYDVFTYPGHDSYLKNKQAAGKDAKSKTVENHDKHKMQPSPVGNKRETLYLRAATLPPERQKESQKASVARTNSCPYKQPSHVHPKLPDYDDIAAKFMALKREHLQNKTLKP